VNSRAKAGLAAAGAAIGAAVAVRTLLRGRADDIGGQVVFITGGSRGLGLGLARTFVEEGCRIAICARDPDELRTAREDLEGRGAEVIAVECDVRDRAQVVRCIERVISHYGHVDILVNNAGDIEVGPVESMALDDFENAMQVMFWGTVYPTLELLPQFVRRKSGRIVNITSIGGKIAVPHLLPYTCAKFAAVGFSEGLHAELAGKGVKVVTIAPGLMRTGSYLNAKFKGDQDKEALWFGLGSSVPGVSMAGERAARQIVDATIRGDAEKILTTPANVAAKLHGVAPGLTSEILGTVARLVLPEGQSRGKKRGHQTGTLGGASMWMSVATLLGRLAARRFLQPAKA
jgi:NAD(P)-dependent dehydrogenase (short-subunit alcohol dehydrogenase family)